ncbi:MAG: hypothetical protein LAT75_00350 [Candidatus Cyclonatronum sp.]|uniref:hypothetical protein n=1 Tax=Cyclonatronum sp. TaxID=3024185 RepID=UPI0025C32950|nr:hypothetical protein [Cyclonatronum sp.]MCH8485282.1 hypothetical protein [Cyclonatronum sp.]
MFFFLAGALTGPQLYAQQVLGARQVGMGQAVTAAGDGAWAVFANPALSAGSPRSVSFYGIRNYGFAELTDAAMAATYQVLGGVAASGLHTYGDELYRETRLRLGYSYGYAGFYAGFALNYTHLLIQGYGSAGAAAIDIGLAWEVIPELRFGARAANLNRGRAGEAREELPAEFALGLAYTISEKALFALDAVKDVRFPLAFRAGLEMELSHAFVLRGGLTTAPQTFSAGAGYRFANFHINLVAQQHYVLGWSPGLDLTLHF